MRDTATRDLFAPAVRVPRIETPAARNSDPQTSHLAAAKVTAVGARRTQAQQVFEALRSNPGLTSAELADKMGVSRFLTARRLPDLVTAGLAMRGAARYCTSCRNASVTWWPVPQASAA